MTAGSTRRIGTSQGLRFAVAALGIAVLAVGATACGGDSKKTATPSAAATAAPTKVSADAQALRQVFVTVTEKWNAKDLDGFIALFTDKGLISSFGDGGTTTDAAKEGLSQFFGTQPLKSRSFSNESISGNVGNMDVVFELGPMLLHSKFTLAKVGTAWKLDGEDSDLPVDVPAGAAIIPVAISDSTLTVDVAAITAVKDTFAFAVKNTSAVKQDLGLATISADAVLADVVKQLGTPTHGDIAGLDFVAGTTAEPGKTSNLAFAHPLNAGRYIIVGSPTDGDGSTAVSFEGRVKEFIIK